MATATMFSQHSSNPLELPSSDAHNQSYLQQYISATRRNAAEGDLSSDDPICGYDPPEFEEYRLRATEAPTVPTKQAGTHQVALEEEEDGDSEDMDVTLQQCWYADDEQRTEDQGEELEDAEEEKTALEERLDTDEEMTVRLKSQEEQDEVDEEIEDLEENVPDLIQNYKIVDRLGTGTFSSVYKAIDLWHHEKWDNRPWLGHHSSSSAPNYQYEEKSKKDKTFVAIKRIYVTSSPERIRNEISIMEECRSCRHISQLITAFRHHDQVVAVMPYHRNQDFREFYKYLPMSGIKDYFRCLFRTLRDIHARGIIHRDVKPANFLFDPRTGVGTLCDFGLASRMEPGPNYGACLHTGPTTKFPHGRPRISNDVDMDDIKATQREAKQKSAWPSDRVGYPDRDTRPYSKANRAGTRGFRSPEVLLKCGEQTGAVDVWSSGMILLFFLTEKFPLFQSGDDIEALMEIATIIGKRKMEKVATLHSRTFATNVPSITYDGITWREFVERQNPELRTPSVQRSHQGSRDSGAETTSSRSSAVRSTASTSTVDPQSHVEDVESALDFLEQIMHPNCTKRLTPRDALYHPFLAEQDKPDDEFFPHPFGGGVCGQFHFVDDVTEEPCVHVKVGEGRDARAEVRKLAAGEGTAIGNNPCEFHQNVLDGCIQ